MNRNSMPLILMLAAGAVTCVITFIRKFSVTAQLSTLFVVLLIFYILGSAIKWTLNYFDKQNEEKAREEEEASAEEAEGTEEPKESRESESKS